jgi:murein DD-endopeptidase MepM/ murein hydrolase activator NlpD
MIAVIATLALLSPSCYQPPVSSTVVDPFRAPACTYCIGNRGLEYQPSGGSPVSAAAAGVVTFSGIVAGVRYLVVAQADGRVATYGRLAAVSLVTGGTVRPGEIIGTTTNRFYFGLREGDRYIDPAPFLGVMRYPPRLVPTDGSAPRHPPPPTVTCDLRHVSAAPRWASVRPGR